MRPLSLLLSALLLVTSAMPVLAAEDGAPSTSVSDYTGESTVIALVSSGFSVDHPALSEAPHNPRLDADSVESVLPGAYLSEKIPAVWDFAAGDADVYHPSYIGTAAATTAAGSFTGAGDVLAEDGTITHEASFYGSAPMAQLLLFKASLDTTVTISPAAAAESIQAAVALGADVIWLDTANLTLTSALSHALQDAESAGIPVLVDAGELSAFVLSRLPEGERPASLTDTGSIAEYAAWPGVTPIAASADPYANVTTFTLVSEGEEDRPVAYTDSCADYFDRSFAALMGGQNLPLISVPGVARAEDYMGLNVEGAIVLLHRGETTFSEKAQAAADAGALAFIVADNGSGLSRMALDGAPIPGVMVDEEMGKVLRDALSPTIQFRAGDHSAAEFSATGIRDELDAAPAFLVQGEGILTGIPNSPLTGSWYARMSSARLAAASAAGYVARAIQYCRETGLSEENALALTAATAQPLFDDEGNRLSLRACGTGIVSGEGEYPALAVYGENASPVTLCGVMSYYSARVPLVITNPTDESIQVTISLSARIADVTESEDGRTVLSGTTRELTTLRAYLGDSAREVNGTSTVTVTLAPGRVWKTYVRLVAPNAAVADVRGDFPYGFFIDGEVSVRYAGGVIEHPYTAFWGEWESAPLADPTIYEDEEPEYVSCRLVTRLYEDGIDYVLPLGAHDPYVTDSPYSEGANLVSPARLGRGWVELELSALRDIDEITATFYDSENHVICRRELGGAEKYEKAGVVQLPLWDFAAVDNPEYLFPDGEYRCEIRLSSDFGGNRIAVEYMGFFFTLDSETPTLVSHAFTEDGDKRLLQIRAEDNEALLRVTVYDAVFTFPVVSDKPAPAQSAFDITLDITQYDELSPIYIEIEDRAGNVTVERIMP